VLLADYASLGLAERIYGILVKKNPPVDDLKQLNPAALYLNRFANGEIDVNIRDNVRNRDVFVIKSSYCLKKRFDGKEIPKLEDMAYNATEMIEEMKLINDALVRASASYITNIMPHMPYQRQDRRAIRYNVCGICRFQA